MSQYMQIRVRVEPVYKKGLAKAFPRFFEIIARYDPHLDDKSPSLYQLTPFLVRLSQEKELPDHVADALDAHGQVILDHRTKAEEAIGGWRLGEAEKHLTAMEDEFLRMEAELPKP